MFKSALESFGLLKKGVAAIRAEITALDKAIESEEENLRQLPKKHLPLPDLKEALLEMVDRRGAGYLKTQVKQAISAYINNSFGRSGGQRGHALNFESIENDITTPHHVTHFPQFLTDGNYNDLVLFALFGNWLKESFAGVMEEMTTDDFGYGRLASKDIGTDRATRRRDIQTSKDKLQKLLARKEELEDNLRQLGVN